MCALVTRSLNFELCYCSSLAVFKNFYTFCRTKAKLENACFTYYNTIANQQLSLSFWHKSHVHLLHALTTSLRASVYRDLHVRNRKPCRGKENRRLLRTDLQSTKQTSLSEHDALCWWILAFKHPVDPST